MKEVLDEFKLRVNEILDHSDNVETIKFRANLKNGIKFNFDYNTKDFEKLDKAKYVPNSVINAVLAIIFFSFSIVFLALRHHVSSAVNMVFVISMAYFILSSISHFMSKTSIIPNKVFFNIKEIITLVIIGVLSYSFVQLKLIDILYSNLVILALIISVFLISVRTKVALISSNVFTIIACTVLCIVLIPNLNAIIILIPILLRYVISLLHGFKVKFITNEFNNSCDIFYFFSLYLLFIFIN